MINEFIRWYEGINKSRSLDYYAPHKPISILFALVKACQEIRWIEYNKDKKDLESIISEFTKFSSKPDCLQPLGRLRNDSKVYHYWETVPAETVINSSGDIPVSFAKEVDLKAGFSDKIYKALIANKAKIHALIKYITEDNFPESLHHTIYDLLGVFDLEIQDSSHETITSTTTKAKRDPNFPKHILSLYGNQCACCGLRVNFRNNTALAMEAAHIKWKARGGECSLDNGIALCPTHHYTFDRGIWTINHDLRIELNENVLIDKKNDTFFTPYLGESIARFILDENNIPALSNIEWHRNNIFK